MPESDSFEETIVLVRAFQRGDQSARERLFTRYLPRIRQIVALRVGRRMRELHEHEDVVQETLLSAVRGLDSFESRGEGSFRHWLAKLVENRIRDAMRRAQALKRGGARERTLAMDDTNVLSASVFEGNEPSPSQVAREHEMQERLELALLAMEEPYRKVIELRRLCELEYSEIATEMDLKNADAARYLFSKAMNELSAAL